MEEQKQNFLLFTYNNETFKRDFGAKNTNKNNQPTHKRGMALR